MSGLNKVMIIGNLGTDPEMRYTANGNAMTSFRVASSRNYTTPDGERREETEWFTIVTWRNLAEQCSQFLQKGRRVYVEGRLLMGSAAFARKSSPIGCFSWIGRRAYRCQRRGRRRRWRPMSFPLNRWNVW